MSLPREKLYSIAAALALLGWVGVQFFDGGGRPGRSAIHAHAEEGNRGGEEMRSTDFGTLRDFDRIVVAGPDTVVVTVGGDFSVRASGRNRAIETLQMTVVQGELRIGRRDAQGWESNREGRGVVIHVSMPAIRAATVTGAGDMRIEGATGDSLAVKFTGSGDLGIGAVDVARLDLEMAGSGDLRLSGRAGSARLSQTGSGDIDARRLMTGRADLSVAGSGDVSLASDGKASVSVTGSGDVRIVGGAQCTISRSGSGEVECG